MIAESLNRDADALAHELRSAIEGEVRFDRGSRALYATDASNYRQTPIGVVIPRTIEDVERTFDACRRVGAPILSRGGGTSLAGQCCNVAVVIDFSKYLNGVIEIDPERRVARVQPGVVLDDLRAAAERHHLTFGPDPATHDRCTLGGMIGNNSCGVHSIMAGMTDANVEELEILTYDGLRFRIGATSDEEYARIVAEGGRRAEIYTSCRALRDRCAEQIRTRFPDIPRRVSGLNLEQLSPENGFNLARALVGSEGTCVAVLEATLKLVASPPARCLLVLGYDDVAAAADHAPEALAHGPIGLEGFGHRMIDAMKRQALLPDDVALLPDGSGWLLVEFGAETAAEAADQAKHLMAALKRAKSAPSMKLFDDPAQQARIWAVREAALGATAQPPGKAPAWPGWEDSSVPPEKLGGYLRDLRALLDKFDYDGAFYGHFGQGCVHTRIDFDLVTQPGITRFRRFLDSAADLVLDYGGSLSGEHGDGQARAALLPKMFGDELVAAFREFKAIWDPGGKMNPGKVVDPNPPDRNLRLGPAYDPPAPKTHFAFPDDQGSFAHATLRCVGVGKCRRHEGGVMCPSYMATREEADSTRGRAHLLFEMLQGETIQDGWRSKHVRESLDLCLACKGCKGECPVHVDVATYKAEFLSHYYAGRIRPVAAYSMGLIHWWARLAAHAPGFANAVTQSPIIGDIAKRAAGVSADRRLPAFADETYKQWFARRQPRRTGGARVLLWPDTFNNHFHPETAIAAVDVLEAAGYSVQTPSGPLCCGRPLYDWGMLDLAKRQLGQILDALRDEIRAGTPFVMLEPSCASVFKDELRNLFPHDEDAKRLSRQTFLFGDFLLNRAPDFDWPSLNHNVLLHGHCHQKALFGMSSDESVLRKLGVKFDCPEPGCCGMAGAFGFERGEHCQVSLAIGERALLPAVRAASNKTLIVADGFSCREQIEQSTGRRALHLAQVVQIALRNRIDGAAPAEGKAARTPSPSTGRTVAIAAAALAVPLAHWLTKRKH